MKKIAIYTAIVGNYDIIRQPLVIDERFDYYLFSNDICEDSIGVWQVRPIPYCNDIQTKIARWVKTHPEELLPNYTCSLWMDGNLQIATKDIYDRCVTLLGEKIPLAGIQHPERCCLYDEGVFCMLAHLESEAIVLPWFHQIYKEGFPQNYGLTETNILFRTHQLSIYFDQLWWQCIKKHSRRDQLSFDYLLWKTGIKCIPFLLNETNARNSTWVNININHKNALHRSLVPTSKQFPFLYYFQALFPYKDYWNHDFNKKYLKIYTKRAPLQRARLLGLFYYIWLKIWKPIKNTFKHDIHYYLFYT